jgi:hypothetical protein
MTDYHSREINAFFLEDALLLESPLAGRVSMGGYGHAGSPMRPRHGAKDPFDTRRNTLNIGCAFEDSGPDAGIGNAFLDISDEHIDHKLIAAKNCPRAPIMKVKRDVVIGINSGRYNDVEIGLGRDSLDSRYVTTEPDHCKIDDGIDASRFELIQASNRIRDPFLFVSPRLGVVLHDFSRKHKHMLVHERHTYLRRIDGASDGIHQSHTYFSGHCGALIDWCSPRHHLLNFELDQDSLLTTTGD